MSYVVIKRALMIALVVGSLLNLINQHDALFGELTFNWFKACLTYCVPFGVSLFSSWLTSRDAKAQCD